jgi:hypothetical protein
MISDLDRVAEKAAATSSAAHLLLLACDGKPDELSSYAAAEQSRIYDSIPRSPSLPPPKRSRGWYGKRLPSTRATLAHEPPINYDAEADVAETMGDDALPAVIPSDIGQEPTLLADSDPYERCDEAAARLSYWRTRAGNLAGGRFGKRGGKNAQWHSARIAASTQGWLKEFLANNPKPK